MRSFSVFLILISTIFLPGCSGSRAERPRVIQDHGFTDTNKIIDRSRIKTGGKILIIPFKAGAGVEENSELEKISMLMVKGIAEELSLGKTPFQILNSEDYNDAEMIIQGHVVRLDQTRGVKQYLPGKKEIILKVSGEVIDRKSKDRLMVFSQQRIGKEPSEDFKSLGGVIGHDIGRFIMTAVE